MIGPLQATTAHHAIVDSAYQEISRRMGEATLVALSSVHPKVCPQMSLQMSMCHDPIIMDLDAVPGVAAAAAQLAESSYALSGRLASYGKRSIELPDKLKSIRDRLVVLRRAVWSMSRFD
jgi:hypothetical protein